MAAFGVAPKIEFRKGSNVFFCSVCGDRQGSRWQDKKKWAGHLLTEHPSENKLDFSDKLWNESEKCFSGKNLHVLNSNLEADEKESLAAKKQAKIKEAIKFSKKVNEFFKRQESFDLIEHLYKEQIHFISDSESIGYTSKAFWGCTVDVLHGRASDEKIPMVAIRKEILNRGQDFINQIVAHEMVHAYIKIVFREVDEQLRDEESSCHHSLFLDIFNDIVKELGMKNVEVFQSPKPKRKIILPK